MRLYLLGYNLLFNFKYYTHSGIATFKTINVNHVIIIRIATG